MTQHNIKMCNPETINIHSARDSCLTQFRNNAISLLSVVYSESEMRFLRLQRLFIYELLLFDEALLMFQT